MPRRSATPATPPPAAGDPPLRLAPVAGLLAAPAAFTRQGAFIECAFALRFQGVLRGARRAGSWHVVAAVPGSGKSTAIDDLAVAAGGHKAADGGLALPVLAIRSPKNAVSEVALGTALSAAFGTVPRMPWDLRRSWLVQQVARAGVELLVVDDAQDLSLPHLAYLKELTDNLAAAPHHRRIGLCLVAAAEGVRVPLRETFELRSELLWRQFRRRLDPAAPYCLVLGHTIEEAREALAGFEDLYRPQLPDLRLCRWARAIHGWLTTPVLDPDRSGRATMDNLSKFAALAVAAAAARGLADVDEAALAGAADLLGFGHGTLAQVDGPPADAPREAVAR